MKYLTRPWLVFLLGALAFGPQAWAEDFRVGFVNTVNAGGWGAPNMGPSASDTALNNVLNSINWTPGGDPNAVNATPINP